MDLRGGKLLIRRSRTFGEDNAPKTAGSERTIELAPFVVEVSKGEKPLHVQPDDFVFLNPNGRPIDVKVFTQWTWSPALRRLNIRPRKFYATRHTFISLALTRGWNLKALAEYCGTSVAMIEKQRRGRHAHAVGAADGPKPEPYPEPFHPRRARARIRAGISAEREGFEPSVGVLPLHTLSRRAPSTTRSPLQVEG